jgi:hypothetical protein
MSVRSTRLLQLVPQADTATWRVIESASLHAVFAYGNELLCLLLVLLEGTALPRLLRSVISTALIFAGSTSFYKTNSVALSPQVNYTD